MTTINVSAFVIPNWHLASTPAKLRLFANQTFLTSDNKSIEVGSPNGTKFYQDVAISISGTNATIAAFTIDSTRDSQTNPNARYSAYFFDSSGTYIAPWDGYNNFQIPATFDTGTTCTWAQILLYNTTAAPIQLDRDTYTKAQILAMIAAVMPGGMNTLASGGTGSNLSATGPGFLRQATLGANVSVSVLALGDLPGGVELSANKGAISGYAPLDTGQLVPVVNLPTLQNHNGLLTVAKGGIGVGTLAANGVLYGNGTSAVQALAVGTGLLTASGGAPSWTQTPSIASITLTGANPITTSSWTQNSIPFVGASGILAENNTGFFWNDSSKLLGVKGSVKLLPATSGAGSVSLLAPAMTGNIVAYTLPDTDGSNGQVLKTNGSGGLMWGPNSGTAGTGITDIMAQAARRNQGHLLPLW